MIKENDVIVHFEKLFIKLIQCRGHITNSIIELKFLIVTLFSFKIDKLLINVRNLGSMNLIDWN